MMVQDRHIINYINEAKKTALLSREEERILALKAVNGDKKATQDLAKANLLLVVKVANEYNNVFRSLDDLIGEGNVGLLRAIQKYDPEKGYRFSTYSTWWIRSMILRYIFNNSHMIKPGTTNEQKKLFYNLRKEQKRLEALGVECDNATIAHNLDVDESDVAEMDCRLRGDVYIDAPISANNQNAYDIPCDPEIHPDNIMEKQEINKKLNDQLKVFSKKLKYKRYRDIFYKRMVAEDPETLQKLANRFKISKERIRQNEEQIEGKLHKFLKKTIN
jgi:RNA polymerase sigma-32 factor